MDGMKGLGGRAGLWDLPWGWPGLAGVPGGVAGLPSCVGGGEIPCSFSWWPGHVLVFSGPQMVPLLLTYGPCHACLLAPPGHCWSFLLVLNV